MNFTKKIMVLLFFLPVLLFAQGEWSSGMSLPEPRSGHGAVVVDSLIYLIGGFTNAQHQASGSCWSYNPATDSWNQDLPSLNYDRANLAVVAKSDTIWVFGGRHMNSMVGAIERFVIGSSAWEVVGTMPDARMGLGAVRVGDEVYLFGGKRSMGMSGLPTNRVDIYNLSSGEWTEGPTLLQARAHFGYALKGDSLICAGGSYLDPMFTAEQLIVGDGWSGLPNLDEPRSNAAAVIYRNNFILLGGYTSGGQSVTNLELIDGQWQEFPGLALPRYNHSAVVYNDDIFVMGGRNGQQVLTSNERYSIDLSTGDNGWQPTERFSISPPWPNPFNSAFEFQVTLPGTQSGQLVLSIYNLAGQQIMTRNLTGIQNRGRVRVEMEDLRGRLSSGIYFLVVNWNGVPGSGTSISKQVIYLK
ncbi:MAG: T9SS type A sorting domain-containing protein [FCB group bacterium]|nr:T9SS type A sorting domain-containing protein [FCB group bacterium]